MFNNYAVIMAGGSGKRLWPLSRFNRPKQVLPLLNGQTLLRRCFENLLSIFPVANILVVTNEEYVESVSKHLPELSMNNILAEPKPRSTAGAIGLAAIAIMQRNENATMFVSTADSILEPPEALTQAILISIGALEADHKTLFTIGIQPTSPNPHLGYLKCTDEEVICGVEKFVEKPNVETAKEFLESGDYLWNSGLFVWKAKTILANLDRFLPEATWVWDQISADWETSSRTETIRSIFGDLPNISIDKAVMEKSSDIACIRLKCSWADLGTFNALQEMLEKDSNGNVVLSTDSELIDSENNVMITEGDHLIATIGLKDILVVHSDNATLICPVTEAYRLKELVERIEQNGKTEYL